MNHIEWSTGLEFGIERIDNQHRHLVSLLNKVSDGHQSGELSDRAQHILQELVDYAATHFADEESCMEQSDYSDLSAHRVEHERFIKEVGVFVELFAAGKLAAVELLDFLQEWLMDHIMNVDQRYAQTLREQFCRNA